MVTCGYIKVEAGFQEGLLDFTLHLEPEVILIGNLVLAVHGNGEKTLLGAKVEDGVAEHRILRVFIFLVYIFGNLGYRVAEKVLDDSGGVGLTGSIGTFNPEGLVDIGVVVVNRADDLPENVIELLICDEDSPCTILFCLDVVGGLLTSQRNDVRIPICHIVYCFLFHFIVVNYRFSIIISCRFVLEQIPEGIVKHCICKIVSKKLVRWSCRNLWHIGFPFQLPESITFHVIERILQRRLLRLDFS